MKNSHFGIIALVAIITFSFVTCDNGNDTETFTVTFNANGGTPAPPSQTIEKGGKIIEPEGVTKANSILDGWYKEAAFSNKWNFAADTVTSDITLHANWAVPHSDPETVTFDKDYDVTIETGVGTLFTVAEWTGIVTRVKNVLEEAYEELYWGTDKAQFKNVFERDVKIVVEKNPQGYSNYKIGIDFQTLYLNVDSIGSVDYRTAVEVMDSHNPNHENIKG
jgi:uncharacterized repeat protein (TIGR02543 family)